jgi:hypothetical protein
MNIHMNTQPVPIPLYTSRGDAEAYLVYPNLFNRQGEWIGFVTPQREVYSVLGRYVGKVTDDRRIVRKRVTSTFKPDRTPPPRPGRISLPAMAALAPLMSELTVSYMDVLLEEPELLHTIDAGEFRQDMD